MRKYKMSLTFLLIFILLTFSGCEKGNSDVDRIKTADFNNIKLIIYCMRSSYINGFPYTKNAMKNSYAYKIETRYMDLKGYRNLLEQLKKVDYTPLKRFQPNYRLYCELYREKWFFHRFHIDQLIMTFDCGSIQRIIINDKIAIKYDPVFYKLVKPFIPNFRYE